METPSEMPGARLLALDTETEPTEFFLIGERCTIGRSSTCDITVPGRLVSRVHARIERDGPRFLLVDAGSANGTFVNNVRILQPHVLQDNDAIGLGSALSVLRFFDPDPTYIPQVRLSYDERTMRFSLGEQQLDLPPTSFRLLAHLYRHVGQLCTREDCAQAIWGREYDAALDAAALDRAVANLRASLRDADPKSDYIQTRRGVGYVLTL